jgi:hypothetical protein
MRRIAKLWILLLLPALPGLADSNTTAATGATATRATPASVSTNVARRPWAGAGPVLIWEVALGDGFGSAVVAGNEVFVLDSEGRQFDVLRAFDLASGQELWNYRYEANDTHPGGYDGSRAAPAVDDKRVYTLGRMGHLHAIDRTTHKPVWNSNLVPDHAARVPYHAFSSNPLLVRDLVVVWADSRKGGMAAFKKDTGVLAWRAQRFGVGETYMSPMLITYQGVEQIVMLNDKSLIAFHPEDGQTLWEHTDVACMQPIAPPLFMEDGRVFVSSGATPKAYMLKVIREGGKWATTQLAHNPHIGLQMHAPIRVGDYLYFLGNSNSRPREGLLCVDMELNLKWQTKRTIDFRHGDFKLVAGVIYAMDQAGILHAILPDPEKYTELAQAPVLPAKDDGEGPIWAAMTFAGTKLLCRNQRMMRCYELSPDAEHRPAKVWSVRAPTVIPRKTARQPPVGTPTIQMP